MTKFYDTYHLVYHFMIDLCSFFMKTHMGRPRAAEGGILDWF
jgi:hypothetical protein